MSQLQDTGKSEEAQASTSDQTVTEADAISKVETADCDMEIASTSSQARKSDEGENQRVVATAKTKRKSMLNSDLEDWIWQDNRHYLEDRNIFEHTYFK